MRCMLSADGPAGRRGRGRQREGAVGMHEAYITVVGKAATPVDFRTSAGGVPFARFRLASTVRRFDRHKGGWTDGATSFYTVWVWRTLARNVASSVAVGEPLVVQGQLRIQEREKDGRRFVSADLVATAVGHDLARGTSAFVRDGPAAPRMTSSQEGPDPVTSAPGSGDGDRAGAPAPALLRAVPAECSAPDDGPAS